MSPQRILLIDDEEDQIGGLREALRALGYEVDYAADGRSGVRKVIEAWQADWPYCAVISDWQMGDRIWNGVYVLVYIGLAVKRYSDAPLPIRILRTRTPDEVRERDPTFPVDIPVVSKDAPFATVIAHLSSTT